MEILGLTCALVMQTAPTILAQNWRDWQRQNPTYPGGLPSQPLPSKARPARLNPNTSSGSELSQTCLHDYQNYLQREQSRLRDKMPGLHEEIVRLTNAYNDCLGRESRNPSGQANPCSYAHRRLLSAQDDLQEQVREIDLMQADLALIARNPQQALNTLPCSTRWYSASRASVFFGQCQCR
jgi:hypothetical protein